MTRKGTITQGSRMMKPQPVVRLTQTRRFGIGIQEWKQAITSAENVDYPMRTRLLDIYEDMMLDSHLTSVIEKRRSNVTSAPISFVRADGTTDENIGMMIESPWFDKFLKDVLDARFYGFSLFQFDTDADGFPTCQMVRRKHVDPVRRMILAEQYDQKGTPFDDFYNLLLVGDPYDLGMLVKAARYVIYKNNDLGDWSEFAEIFGMPIREYTYDATDEDSRRRILEDARSQGAAQVYVHPEGTSLNLIESGGKTGSLDIYKGLADFCNAELSKLFLGNTLTTQAGDTGTQALGTVQKKSEDMILGEDRKYVLNVLNYHMTDIFAAMGMDTRAGKFQYEETEDDDMEKQLRIVQGLQGMGLNIDEDYLYEKFGVKKGGEKAANRQGKEGEEKKGERAEQRAERTPERGENGEDERADGDVSQDDRKGGIKGGKGIDEGKKQLSLWQRFFDEGARRR